MNSIDPIRLAGLGALSVLPDALLSIVTFYLDIRTACKLACCSKLLRVFAYEPCLWMHHALAGHDGPLAYQANWRHTALHLIHQAAAADATASHTTCRLPASLIDQPPTHLAHLKAAVAAAAAKPQAPQVPGFYSEFLYRRWYRSHVDLSGFTPPVDQVPRVQHGSLDAEGFMQLYDKPAQPVILTGFMDAEWPTGWQHHWQLHNLATTYPYALLQASRPSGGKTNMKLCEYVDYMERQRDEEPLYIFDERFGEAVPEVLEWYQPPSVIGQDLTDGLSSSVRPAYRWLVIGPCRAGASWHVDPALTSAWNSLTSGLKRWALYPPHITPPGLHHIQQQQQQSWAAAPAGSMPAAAVDDQAAEVSSSSSSSWCTVSSSECDVDDGASSSSSSGSSSSSDHGDDSAGSGLTSLQWYLEVYPHLPPHHRPYEFLQHPGETVYIPGGWWHLVLNLRPSVAVTQNFVTTSNLDRVVGHLALGHRAYESDPLQFYDSGSRWWASDWQQRQRRALGGCAEVVSAAAAAAGVAAINSNPGEVNHLPITYNRYLSPYGSEVVAADIVCHAAAKCNEPAAAAAAVNDADSGGSDVAAVAAAAAAAPGVWTSDGFMCDPDPDPDHAFVPAVPWYSLLQCMTNNKGYQRSKILGPWLRQIWQQQQQQPGLASQITAAATKYLGQQEWQQLLLTICKAHDIQITRSSQIAASSSSSRSLDDDQIQEMLLFPDLGSDSIVFHVCDHAVIKILVGQDDLPAQTAAAVEALLLRALQQQQQQQQLQGDVCLRGGDTQHLLFPAAAAAAGEVQQAAESAAAANVKSPSKEQQQQQDLHQQQQQLRGPSISTPELLGHGTISITTTTTSSSSSDCVLCSVPYLVLSKATGAATAAAVADQLTRQQQQQLAVACGQFLAQIHSLPLDLMQKSGSSSSSSSSDSRPTVSCSSSNLLNATRCANDDSSKQAVDRCVSGCGNTCNLQQQQQQQDDVVSSTHQLVQQIINNPVWRSREGTIWSSQYGCCDRQKYLSHHHHQQQQQQHVQAPAAADGPVSTINSINSSSHMYSIPATAAAAASAWWPFLQYLQQRRSDLMQQIEDNQSDLSKQGSVASHILTNCSAAADHLAAAELTQQQQQQQGCLITCSSSSGSSTYPVLGVGEDCLPSWLVRQVASFIPQDLGQLVGCAAAAAAAAAGTPVEVGDSDVSSSSSAGKHPPAAYNNSSHTSDWKCTSNNSKCVGANSSSSSSSSSMLPVWLHGDLMAGNLLLQLASAQQKSSHLQQQEQQQSAATCASSGLAQPCGQNLPVIDDISDHAKIVQDHTKSILPPVQSDVIQHISVIDLCDGGVGDPLYDFVAVLVSVLHCNVDLMKQAVLAYSQAVGSCSRQMVTQTHREAKCNSNQCNYCSDKSQRHYHESVDALDDQQHHEQQQEVEGIAAAFEVVRVGRPDGAESDSSSVCSVSKRFLVYLLLHEEGVMGQLLQQHPHLRSTGSLEVAQRQLFGWMDDVWPWCY